MDKKESSAFRIKKAMEEKGMKQIDVVRSSKYLEPKYGTSISKPDISQYLSGRNDPGQDKLTILAEILGVNEAWLMGYPVSKHKVKKEIETISVPLVGEIAAGTPILAQENIQDYFNIDARVKSDFCLKIKGRSMIDAGIYDGDIVFIRQQPTLEVGEIGAIQIGEEATLKRFYRTNDSIILQPANSDYLPQVYTSDSDIKILGKLVATLHFNE